MVKAVSQQSTGPGQHWDLSNWRYSLFDKRGLKTEVNFTDGQSIVLGMPLAPKDTVQTRGKSSDVQT